MDDEVVLGRRRGQRWTKLGYGVYRRAGNDEAGRGLADLRAWQQVLPSSAAYTHLTGARVHGLWLPPMPAHLPLVVGLPKAGTRPKRPQLRCVRQTTSAAPVLAQGLRVAPVAETLLACAHDLGLLDLGVLVDSALHLRLWSEEQLRATAAPRRRGAPALRAALACADARSESPWETLLRLFHVTCEVPVVPQFEVRDERGGFVARGDLWLRGTRTLHEYDGAVHRDRRTHVHDLARERRLANLGWTRRGYTSEDLLDRADQVLREADAALGRPHDRARLDRWWALLDESLFTSRGRRRLARRWGLDRR